MFPEGASGKAQFPGALLVWYEELRRVSVRTTDHSQAKSSERTCQLATGRNRGPTRISGSGSDPSSRLEALPSPRHVNGRRRCTAVLRHILFPTISTMTSERGTSVQAFTSSLP